MKKLLGRTHDYLSLIRFSHTIFAMPFALAGYFIGATRPGYGFSLKTFLLVLACMVFARSAAISSLLFILSAALLNKLTFILSPVALIIVLGYSYTKRFTPLCHLGF